MPSIHQHAGTVTEFDTETERLVATKDIPTLVAIARGVDDPDRVHDYIQTEIEVAETDGREPREAVIGAFNQRLADLES